jgi:LysM repeat protein
MEMISELPGIVGYVTKKGDTQWSVAKKFYTTVESLRSINELKNDELQSGQMLLVVKKIV